MTAAMLYLHETIDILGSGQDGYMRSVHERAAHSAEAGISRLVGCWRVVGSTGRWPQVVNLWEMDGWSHWAEALERQFVPARKDASLAPWWTRTAEFRSGGFDRILVPASDCPTQAELLASRRKAWVFEQTITRVDTDASLFVDEAIGALRPLVGRRGIELVGAYVAPMTPGEVVWIWSAPTFSVLCAWYEERDREVGWRRWLDGRGRRFGAGTSHWLVPAEDSPWHPGHD